MSDSSGADPCSTSSPDRITDNNSVPVFSPIRSTDAITFREFSRQIKNKNTEHDWILLVKGKEFFVKSYLLCHSSTFFEDLFGNGSQNQFELRDVEVADFMMYLHHIYDFRACMRVNNMLVLLSLADRFSNKFLLDKCDKFISTRLHHVLKDDLKGINLLKLAFARDLQDIKCYFIDELNKADINCRVCKMGPRCLRNDKILKNRSLDMDKTLYLSYDGFLWRNRDEIMQLDTPIIKFIYEILFLTNPSPYGSSRVPDSPIRCNKSFSTPGKFDDSIIEVNGRQFHVNSKIVTESAKWFAGRLSNGTKLTISDVTTNDMHLFLNFVYPNCNEIPYRNRFRLFELTHRFEYTALYDSIFRDLKEWTIPADPKDIVDYIEMAIKYDLRELKKVLYVSLMFEHTSVRCVHDSCKNKEIQECSSGNKNSDKKHKFQMNGVFYDMRHKMHVFSEPDFMRTLSAEGKRFVLSCFFKNLSKFMWIYCILRGVCSFLELTLFY